jgi:hypothetical protein
MLVKLRGHVYLLEQDVTKKLVQCNILIAKYGSGKIRTVHAHAPYEVAGEAVAYASVLDLLHTSMRELGMQYQS